MSFCNKELAIKRFEIGKLTMIPRYPLPVLSCLSALKYLHFIIKTQDWTRRVGKELPPTPPPHQILVTYVCLDPGPSDWKLAVSSLSPARAWSADAQPSLLGRCRYCPRSGRSRLSIFSSTWINSLQSGLNADVVTRQGQRPGFQAFIAYILSSVSWSFPL